MTPELKLFFVRRGKTDWLGGLVICAADRIKALEIFRNKEGTPARYGAVELTFEPGVVHDDEAR